MSKITGGYYIKARKIQESAIAKSPPHVREIWDWLLKTANHKDMKTFGVIIKRGQLFTSYQEIQDELSWKVGFIKKSYKKHNVDSAMVWLRHEQMILTQKTTRGLLITVCNYERYQDPTNYEKAYGYDNETTGLRQVTSTISKNDKNDNNEINKNSNGQSLKNSNLFRQPNIPKFEEVVRVFLQGGGNEKMAKNFFDKNASTDWFYKGSPITNFSNLVPSFIEQWKSNDKKNNNERNSGQIGKDIEFDKA